MSRLISSTIVAFAMTLAITPCLAGTPNQQESYLVRIGSTDVSFRVPVSWSTLPTDPGYVYLANGDRRKKISIYAQPTKVNHTAEGRASSAIRRLRNLQQNVNKGRQAKSRLKEITRGPALQLDNGLASASWMYRVVRQDKPEIRYWTIVILHQRLMYHVELRWETDSSEDVEMLSLKQRFREEFEPFCQTLRIEPADKPLPIELVRLAK